MIPVEQSEFTTKQENITNDSKTVASPSSTTTSWSRLKNPRIVRVSRAFGGKDRHSKVCTVRGLRDRRVRLSAPTAIQLYDLQDQLGLNQPSKVVDWLLNVAKNEIDELPPLQIPQGLSFSQTMQTSHEIISASQLAKQGLKISDVVMNSSHDVWGKETSAQREENWEERQFQENQGSYFTTSNNFLSRPNFLLNNISSTPYNPFVRWDPSNLTLSQPQDDHQNFSVIPSASNQVLVYHQHGTNLQSYLFPSQNEYNRSSDFTEKQPHFENSQLSSNSAFTSHVDSSITTNVRPFHFSMAENFLPRNEQNKDEFH